MKANHEQLIREIARREQAEEKLKERLGFEALLSDLSGRFVIVSAEEINRAIEHALKQILEFFQVDRFALIRVLKDKNSWEITHIVQREETYPLPVNTEMPASMFPWVYAKILGREVVTFDSLRDSRPRRRSISRPMKHWGLKPTSTFPWAILDPIFIVWSLKQSALANVLFIS